MASKRVLLIGIGFYDYEEAIAKEFNRLNYEVDYFSEVPPYNLAYRYFSRRKNKTKIQEINNRHIFKIVNDCRSDYDLVFIIKCEIMTADALKMLRSKNPNAKFILYLWDSIQRIAGVESKFPFFDKVFSFDRFDCISNNLLIFNPLFFRNEYDHIGGVEQIRLDVYHLGWYHSDRLQLVKRMVEFCKENNFKYKMILLTGWFSYFMQSLFGGELRGNKKYLIFKPVSTHQNYKYLCMSRTILDIAHPQQVGLTMRTIELLGMRKKIITTNKDVINYDFYHPNNVLVIDREAPVFDKSFFESEYCPVSEEILSRYSIENWLIRMVS